MRGGAPRSLITALMLVKTPALADVLRQRLALPDDIIVLVRIAGGCEETTRDAAAALGTPAPILTAAARFYLEQVLFSVESDSYRVLGLTPDAPQTVVREHGRWLLRWLHPDSENAKWESAFAPRVVAAWNDVKSPARRAAYDNTQSAVRRRAFHRGRPITLSCPLILDAADDSGARTPRGRALRFAVGAAAFLLTWLVPLSALVPLSDNERAQCAEEIDSRSKVCLLNREVVPFAAHSPTIKG